MSATMATLHPEPGDVVVLTLDQRLTPELKDSLGEVVPNADVREPAA